MMLIRMDPNSSTINVLSIPRDLKVQIPEHGIPVDSKLNSAYSVGGPNLLVKVIQQNVFPDLQVNHIVDINFGGFESLVNTIGCVYTDVDHRYYNNTAVTNYSSIDIQPGYQKLCGPDALAFVRYRHTDSDIVRSARQQDFIRWAKDQYGTSQLVANRNKLLTIFGQHTQTDRDLHTVDALINLFNLVAFSAGHAIKQIAFPAILLPCNPAPTPRAQTPCYVGANPGAEQRAFNQLMTPTLQQPSAPRGPRAPRAAPPPPPNVADLTPDVGDGKSQASSLGNVGMPVYFPRLLASGSSYCGISGTCPVGPGPGSYPRAYTLHDSNGTSYPAYRMTLVMDPAQGQYYGVEGTTWQNPPILGSPTETRTVGGKQLALYFNGRKLAVVAWRTPQGVYWISNTLTDDLRNPQMLGITASLIRAGP